MISSPQLTAHKSCLWIYVLQPDAHRIGDTFIGAVLLSAKCIPYHIVKSHLDETNISALLSEALTANVQSIFSDDTSLMCADSAFVMLAQSMILSVLIHAVQPLRYFPPLLCHHSHPLLDFHNEKSRHTKILSLFRKFVVWSTRLIRET